MAKDEDEALRDAQIALVDLHEAVARQGRRVIVILEGRDAAGKDGTIRRITENLPARQVRAVSLPAPNERERRAWYFQRYVAEFPVGGEIVIFNRSWYNRAGVEPVMGFCTPAEHEAFLRAAPRFEELLAADGFELVKYYLDISRKEQKDRLKARAEDPLKRWKIGPLDAKALEKFDAYSHARDEMFTRTSSPAAPWIVVRADHKPTARLNLIRDLISRLAPQAQDTAGKPDPSVVRVFDAALLSDGYLSR